MIEFLLFAAMFIFPLVVTLFCVHSVIMFIQVRKLFRSVRKMAELYPPFIPSNNELEDRNLKTEVIVNEQWDENINGRD